MVKMESVSKITIFGLKIDCKKMLYNFFFFETPTYGKWVIYEVKENNFPNWGISKKSRPLGTIIFRPKMVILGTNSLLKMYSMYE